MSTRQTSIQRRYYSNYDDGVPRGLMPMNDRILDISRSAYDLTEFGAFTDKLRATLAKQALDNTAFLAKLEEEYLQTAPCGAEEYDLIIKDFSPHHFCVSVERTDYAPISLSEIMKRIKDSSI